MSFVELRISNKATLISPVTNDLGCTISARLYIYWAKFNIIGQDSIYVKFGSIYQGKDKIGQFKKYFPLVYSKKHFTIYGEEYEVVENSEVLSGEYTVKAHVVCNGSTYATVRAQPLQWNPLKEWGGIARVEFDDRDGLVPSLISLIYTKYLVEPSGG